MGLGRKGLAYRGRRLILPRPGSGSRFCGKVRPSVGPTAGLPPDPVAAAERAARRGRRGHPSFWEPTMSAGNSEIGSMRLSRRLWLRRVGAFGLGAAAVCATGPTARAQLPPDQVDPGLLNFALNMEYVQAEYYLRALGRSLDDSLLGAEPGEVIGGSAVPFESDDLRQFAEEFANDQSAHISFLRAALGDEAISRPTINFTDSFNIIGRSAGLVGPDETWDPFADDETFLLGAFFFEDVGVTMYKGFAPFLQDPAAVEAVGGLLGTEAYQAGAVRTLLFQRGADAQAAANALSALRDTLNPGEDIDQGLTMLVPAEDVGEPLPTRRAIAVPEQAVQTVTRRPGAAVAPPEGQELVVRRLPAPAAQGGLVGNVTRARMEVAQEELQGLVRRARAPVAAQPVEPGLVRQLPAVQDVAEQTEAVTPLVRRGQVPVVQEPTGVIMRAGVPVATQLPEQITVTANIVPDDVNGLVFSRTVSETLRILYLTPLLGIADGGFLPEGARGELTTT